MAFKDLLSQPNDITEFNYKKYPEPAYEILLILVLRELHFLIHLSVTTTILLRRKR